MSDTESRKPEDTAFSLKTVDFPNVVSLNVGGRLFATHLSTLRRYPESMLAVMFSGRHEVKMDSNSNYFIDRDGEHFHHILNFLRDDHELPPPSASEAVMREANYYALDDLVDTLKLTPPLFAEYIVRENIRRKLFCYNYVKDELIRLSQKEAEDDGVIVSHVQFVTSKNQPIPRDLQFSKQVYKQYFRKFKTFDTLEQSYGKYCVHIPCEDVDGNPQDVMDNVASCLLHDLMRDGYHVSQKSEGIYVEQNKLRTVTWCDEEFHVCTSFHVFTFDWLDTGGSRSK